MSNKGRQTYNSHPSSAPPQKPPPPQCTVEKHRHLLSFLRTVRSAIFGLQWRYDFGSDDVERIKHKLRVERESRSFGDGGEDETTVQLKLDKAERDVISLRSKVDALQRDIRNTKLLSETRRRELKAAQAFLSTADNLSIQTAITSVEGLNNLILQATSVLDEALDGEKRNGTADPDFILHEAGRIIAERLFSSQHPPLPIGLVLQFLLVSWCKKTLESWDPVPEASMKVQEIYSSIRQHTNQSVAGKWRALTRSGHTASSKVSRTELQAYIKHLLSGLGFVLTESLARVLERQFHPIADHLIALKETFGGIISMDLEVILINTGSPFDEETMIDEDAGAGNRRRRTTTANRQLVMGTSQLGLRSSKITRNTSGEREIVEAILTRPQVIVFTS